MFHVYKICRLYCFRASDFPQKKTFKFYKVVQRHYSGEVGNVDITLYRKFIQYTTHRILSESSKFL